MATSYLNSESGIYKELPCNILNFDMTTTQPNNITMSSGQFLFITANYRIYTKSVYTLMPFTNKISGIKAN